MTRRPAAAVVAVVLALCGSLLVAAPASAASTSLSLSLSESSVRRGEMVWLKGRLTVGGRAAASRVVAVESRSGSSSWKVVSKTRTGSDGTYSIRQRPDVETVFRVRSVDPAVTSTARKLSFSQGSRGLWQRYDILEGLLGDPRYSTKSASVKGFAKVRFRSFDKGMLVQTTRPSGSTRTWVVYGDVLAAYRDAGGPRGSLGVPLGDPRCGLLESGCVQRFSGGSVYDNSSTRGVVFRGSGRLSEFVAAAKSQVGYRQTRYNDSKYNRWIGRTGAWCSVFQSWAAAASGNASVIPQNATFSGFLSSVRSRMPLGQTPKVGALVFYDTIDDGRTAATHVGIVVKVTSSTIVAIEGNTSTPGSSTGRGVYMKERSRSLPLYYAYPSW
ncbi:CHAP domain-containing protein [Cellulomonas massiliensis]|uniref:CHAP domain-containing protein n=1 Tax=Cellulomonas massiliensis TaxID=1465811 RepID=UPI000306583A|nr:CHAP domain-containing protein [Cellulomonas massiliensis]